MIDQMSLHYEEQTPYILVDNVTPLMNSLPFPRGYMGNKKLKKVLREHSANDNVQNIMNIAFQKPQDLNIGDIVDWSLRGIDLNVVVLSHEKAFVKGTYVWMVVVGIIEE